MGALNWCIFRKIQVVCHCKMCSNVSLPSLHIAQLKSDEYLSLKLTFISKTPSLALKIILAVCGDKAVR